MALSATKYACFFFWWICYQEVNVVAFPITLWHIKLPQLTGSTSSPNFSQFLFVYLAFLIVKTPDNLVDLLFILLRFV